MDSFERKTGRMVEIYNREASHDILPDFLTL
jgi:hypothetical protein